MKSFCDFLVKLRLILIFKILTLIAAIGIAVILLCPSLRQAYGPDTHSPLFLTLSSVASILPLLNAVLEPGIKNRYNQLIQENARLSPLKNNIENIFKVWMELVLDVMRVGSSWRASFYILDERDGGKSFFRLVARRSKDEKLEIKGRRYFPATEGVIGRAWKDSSPVFYYAKDEYCADKKSYAAGMQLDFKMEYKDAIKLTMISHCIMGTVLYDIAGNKRGVVIVESANKIDKKSKNNLQRRFKIATGMIAPYITKIAKESSTYLLGEEELQEG